MNRVKIRKTGEKIRVEIKAHNSLLHVFFVLLVIIAVASFFYYMLPVFSVFSQRFIFVILGKIMLTAGLSAALFMLLRSFLWSAGGKEVIEAGGGIFVYSKKIFNIGFKKTFPLSAVNEIKVIDYVQPKDILHMMRSELNFDGKSFLIECGDKKLRFGVYLSVDETEEIERVLFPAVSGTA